MSIKKFLNERVNFTRSSTGYYWDENGILQEANVNEPRWGHDPVTGEMKGLLIEESKTNLLTYSEQFDDNSWSKNLISSIAANQSTAPDGSITADHVSFDGTVNGRVQKSFSPSGDTTYTASIFIKLISGTLSNSNNELAIFGDVVSAQFTNYNDLGSEWKRYDVTATSTATPSSFTVQVRCDDTATIAIWGAQLEQASFPTSYIPTTNAQVTRSADVADITDLSWYNQDEGTFVVEGFKTAFAVNARMIMSLDDGSFINQINFESDAGNDIFVFIKNAFNVVSSNTFTDKFRFALALGVDSSISLNGVLTTTTNDYNYADLNRFWIGRERSGSYFNNYIKSIKYYPRRLSNEQLKQLTS